MVESRPGFESLAEFLQMCQQIVSLQAIRIIHNTQVSATEIVCLIHDFLHFFSVRAAPVHVKKRVVQGITVKISHRQSHWLPRNKPLSTWIKKLRVAQKKASVTIRSPDIA